MSDPVLFGLSKSQWELINSFSSWLSAIGTIAAVVVSLYLANRIATPKAKLTVGHRIIVTPGAKGPAPEYVLFQIVNTGERPIRITSIGWRIGLWVKRQAIQMYEETISSPLPVDLTHGQEAKWLIPLTARKEPWLKYFSKGMLRPNCKISCFLLRAQAYTSTGHVFEIKPERNLISKLQAACKEVSEE